MIIDSNRIPTGLSVASVKALCHLAEHGSTNATGMARVASFSTAAATGLIDSLEKAGLIRRIPRESDRRAIDLVLTHRGRLVVEGMKPEAQPEPAAAAA